MKIKAALLCVYWNMRPLSGLQYVDLVKSYVAGLVQLSAVFQRMHVLGKSKEDTERLDVSLGNAEQLIWTGLPKDWSFLSAEGARIPPGPNSYTRNGFVNTLTTSLDYEAPGAVIETCMGSIDVQADSSLIVRLRGEELTTEDFLRKLFEFTISFWRPVYGYLEVDGHTTTHDNVNLDEIPLGWLTYVADQRLLVVTSANVQAERCAAGTLAEVSGGHAPSENPTFVEHLRALRERLRSEGLLKNPLASDTI